jgi:hypothetical protein
MQPDVGFKDLGLVIIDEEQRFGVTHKEFFKRLRTEVDVLTMTATPIPRTLYMALTGVRDISHHQHPPAERLPIITHIGPIRRAWCARPSARIGARRAGLLCPQPGADHPGDGKALESPGARGARGGGARADARRRTVAGDDRFTQGRSMCCCAPRSSNRAWISPTPIPDRRPG